MDINLVDVERTTKATPMDRIYEQLKDKNVRAIKLYGNSSKKLYFDAAKEIPAVEDVVTDAFTKGMLLIDDGTDVLVPVAMTGATVKTVGASGLDSWTVPTT